MKKLCIGTLLRILKFTKKESVGFGNLVTELLCLVKNDTRFNAYNTTFYNALKNGKNDLSDYGEIKTIDKKALISDFQAIIEPNFDDVSKKIIIACIQNVLLEDDIDDMTNIGFEHEGYTKWDITRKQKFSFSELLANIFYYVSIDVRNIPYAIRIKELDESYVRSIADKAKSIILDEKLPHLQSELKSTIKDNCFKSTFRNLGTYHTNDNNNQFQIFCLDIVNYQFNYDELYKFIQNSIASYIQSRALRNRYNISEDAGILFMKAMKAYKDKVNSNESTNHFNELLLYAFLECSLGAPKIFSKLELQNKSGQYDSKSSGIHILTLKKDGALFHQLVLGATDSVNSINEAIDNAFNQVAEINSSIDNEINLVNETILNEEFDMETNKSLEEIMIPSEDSSIEKPDNAYGIFIGYTPTPITETDGYQYKVKMKEQIVKDIESASEYIMEKIEGMNLTNHSFYVYFLPFNDATNDCKEIIKKALEV